MQATALGRYLLYGRGGDFLAHGRGPLPLSPQRVQSEPAPSESADWTVDGAGGAFTLTLAGRALAVAGGGALVLAPSGTTFAFEPAEGCAAYPRRRRTSAGSRAAARPPPAR